MAHSSWQGCQPGLHLTPRALWREKWGRSGERRGRKGKRERWSGGNSKGSVNGLPLPLWPHLAGRDPRGKEIPCPAQSSLPFPQITHHRCTSPPRPAGPVRCTRPLAPNPHPTCSSQTHPPQMCKLPVHPRYTRHSPVPRTQPHPHTITWCTGGHAPTPSTTGHAHVHTRYTFTEAQGLT